MKKFKMNKEKIIKVFAGNIRAERARNCYTQESLAEKADISTEYVTKIEKEKYNPTLAVAVNLAAALGVTLDTLVPPELYLNKK